MLVLHVFNLLFSNEAGEGKNCIVAIVSESFERDSG